MAGCFEANVLNPYACRRLGTRQALVLGHAERRASIDHLGQRLEKAAIAFERLLTS